MAYSLRAADRPTTFKPGEIARRSGRYEVVGPRGGHTGIARRVEKGAPLPPAPKAGQRYALISRVLI